MLTRFTILSLLCFILLSCGREDVRPSDYAAPGDVRPNEFVLRAETRMLSPADKSFIVGFNAEGILVRPEAAFLDSIAVGSILVNTAADPGDSIAFFRRVTEIIPLSNNIALRTEDVNLPDAFSRYIIDSRSTVSIIQRNPTFPVVVECSPEKLDGWLGLSLGTEPNISHFIAFDADSTYFSAQYDETGALPFRKKMRIKDLRMDITGNIKFHGELSAGPAIELDEPIPLFPIGETGLTLYLSPKAEFKLNAGGEISSPTLTFTSGPHNIFFEYDQRNAQALAYSPIPHFVPTVVQTADWSGSMDGSFEVQVGADIFMGITGLDELVRAGIFIFGYTSVNGDRRGNFIDLQPRLAFDADLGVGTKFFAELAFLSETESWSGASEWINLTGTLESPDFKSEITKWNLGVTETCARFNKAALDAANFQQTNQISLDVACNGCGGTGYLAWINDQPANNGLPLPYNQAVAISLPPGISLLNGIGIQDVSSFGCYLEDTFMDPSLLNNTCTQFTDGRDGNTYCSVQIGSQTWMGENLRYSGGGQIGHWYLNLPSPDTILFGRLYTFSEALAGEEANAPGEQRRIRGLCPQGWHLPTQEEWRTLRTTIAKTDYQVGKALKLPSEIVWPASDLPASSLFNAVSAGEYYPWILNGSVSGNRFRKTTFWSSSRGQYGGANNPPVVLELDESNSFGLAQAGSSVGLGSIEQIGYSCRCVKD